MKKSELFTEIINAVSEKTEIKSERILSPCRVTEVVDARYILVKMLHSYGIYPANIADMVGITKRSVSMILSNFDNRKSYSKMMGINYENIRNVLGNKCLPE